MKSKGLKIAIIQNEASGVGIEDDLKLVDDQGQPVADLKEIGGGCVCCSVRSDFVSALEALLKARRFDRIFVECSGIADPGQLASMFWLDDELEGGIYLDGIIGLVDARMTRLSESEPQGAQIIHQLAYADVMLLNKKDLVDKARIDNVCKQLKAINPAPILVTTRSRANLTKVLDLKAYSAEAAQSAVAVAAAAAHDHKKVSGHAHAGHAHGGHDCSGDDHCSHPDHSRKEDMKKSAECVHDRAITSCILEVSGELSMKALRQWLADLLWHGDNEVTAGQSLKGEVKTAAEIRGVTAARSTRTEVFRMKGLMRVDGSNKRQYLQAVQEMFEVTEGPEWTKAEAGVNSKVVVIGKNLDSKQLQTGLEACQVGRGAKAAERKFGSSAESVAASV